MENAKDYSEQESNFEVLIEALMDQGFGISDALLPAETIAGLRESLLTHHVAGAMRPAGIGKQQDFQHNKQIRGDVIRWLEPETPANTHEKTFLALLSQFMQYLNRTCYTGLNAYEFHYAYYAPGSFYQRHLDQFRADSGRKYSLVLYLNEGWNPEDGGQLKIYAREGEREILPVEGRMVFFESDKLEHEVLPSASRFRLSIAGWLKSMVV